MAALTTESISVITPAPQLQTGPITAEANDVTISENPSNEFARAWNMTQVIEATQTVAVLGDIRWPSLSACTKLRTPDTQKLNTTSARQTLGHRQQLVKLQDGLVNRPLQESAPSHHNRRNTTEKHGTRYPTSRSHVEGGDHTRQPNTFRRPNNQKGQGEAHNNNNRERGNNYHRRNRDGPTQQQIGTVATTQSFMFTPQHPPINPFFLPPHNVVPFFLPPLQPQPQPHLPPHFPADLHLKILNQIDYYFSRENLVRDIYLRMSMDENGWVPVALISKFNKMRNLTNDIPTILKAVEQSTAVEVEGGKIRKRGAGGTWKLPNDFEIPIS